MKTPIRVAVTGAAGQIGYSLVFRIASGAMFGSDQPLILQLIEAPIEKAMKALEGVDAKVLQSLASVGMQPDQLIALAFQGLAERADKIGQLNVSPDLLHDLLTLRPKT